MPAVVIDATGNLNAINTAFQCIAHGGRFVLIGPQKEGTNVNHSEFPKWEVTLMSCRNATIDDFNQVISAIKNKSVQPIGYITHRSSFKNVASSFQIWLDPENEVIKAMVSV